jgi:hypothetical protein
LGAPELALPELALVLPELALGLAWAASREAKRQQDSSRYSTQAGSQHSGSTLTATQ